MQDEDRKEVTPPARTDQPDADPEEDDAGRRAPDAEPERAPGRRPIHALGAGGCLVMALAAVAGIALLSTGNFFAGAAGILIVAVASGVGLWLYTIESLRKK